MNTELPEEKVNAGDVTPVQIAPWGEHPNGDTVQILDEEAASRVVADFDGEILVDMVSRKGRAPVWSLLRIRLSTVGLSTFRQETQRR